MNKNWGKLAVVAFAALIAGQLLLQRARPTRPRMALSATAPPLVLPDVSGRQVDLASLRGRVVAVNFWASWCGPCRMEIPELARVWRENRDRCFEMLGVAEESGTPDQVAAAARDLEIPYPVLVDRDGSAAERYRVGGFPQTVLVDAQGKVRRVFQGAVRGSDLEAAVRPLLPAPETGCPRA